MAAGESSRLGKAKQLLHFHGKTLLHHIIEEAIKSEADPVVVVTGAFASEIVASIANTKAVIVENNNWKSGMASGIVAGIQKLKDLKSNPEKIILAVCDQPFVTATLFRQLEEKQAESGKQIVACAYADTLGTPVLFTHKYFGQLLQLKGDSGAKKILGTFREDVAAVEFPQGAIDIDTLEDYERLMDQQQHVL